jgi:hypothetical protein
MRVTLFFCVLIGFIGLTGGSCSSKNNGGSAEAPFKAPGLGVTLKIPKGFEPLSPQQMRETETMGATVATVEPFTVLPRYGFQDNSGKGVLVVSELKFTEPDNAEAYPMDNLYTYQKNLETFFNAGEISSEEQNNGDISLILMGMSFDQEGNEVTLFKGLCYKYPEQFFMIDLYAVNAKTTQEDALAYQNMFYSIGIL